MDYIQLRVREHENVVNQFLMVLPYLDVNQLRDYRDIHKNGATPYSHEILRIAMEEIEKKERCENDRIRTTRNRLDGTPQ